DYYCQVWDSRTKSVLF
nr:immunoglobulin light chain junction region [Macaca mulatta]